MAHIVFLLESAGLEYIVKNIAKNTEQKQQQKMRKEKYHEEIIQKGQHLTSRSSQKREQRKEREEMFKWLLSLQMEKVH